MIHKLPFKRTISEMEIPQYEMETSKTSQCTENAISKSWILVNSDETSHCIVCEKADANIEGTTDEHSSNENVSDNTNNKSDTESDGISVISESEFYNSRNDDDSSINSFDENTSDYIKVPTMQDTEQNECQESLETPNKQKLTKMGSETPKGTERSLNISSPLNMTKQVEVTPECVSMIEEILTVFSSTGDNDDITRQTTTMTSSDDTRGSANLAKKLLNKKHDTFSSFHIIWLSGTFLFALLAYTIPLKTNLESTCNADNLGHNYQNIVKYCSVLENLQMYQFCQYIYESTEKVREYNIEKCFKKILKGMKADESNKYHSKSIGTTIESTYNTNDVEFAPNENHVEKRMKYKENSIEQKHHDLTDELYSRNNIKLERNKRSYNSKTKLKKKRLAKLYRCTENIAKHYKENISTEKKNEAFDTMNCKKGNLDSCIKNLAEKEKRLMGWEMDLARREKIYIKNTISSYSAPHKFNQKNFPYNKKTTPDRSKNKKDKSKNEDFKFNKSFGKNLKNQRTPTFLDGVPGKAKYDMHQIPLKEWRNSVMNNRKTHSREEITGEWYFNLIRSRSDVRRRNGVANWWFDRVHFRNLQRNKAYWYFQYMYNRENLRYKKS